MFLGRTPLPVSKIYKFEWESDVGTPFILMQKLPGSALEWSEASSEQRTKVLTQLADTFVELERRSFSALGSFSRGGKIGSYAQEAMFPTPSQAIGPFGTPQEASSAMIQNALLMIENGTLSTFAVDNYLTHLWRLEHLPSLFPADNPYQKAHYLKHEDDKGDHILVDAEYNITGIIDWEFASTEPKQRAFSSPAMIWPVADFYEGDNALSLEEVEFAAIFRQRGRDDMADFVLNGRKVQRFFFGLGDVCEPERETFEKLFQGLRRAFNERAEVSTYASWKQSMLARYKDNTVLAGLLKEEQ